MRAVALSELTRQKAKQSQSIGRGGKLTDPNLTGDLHSERISAECVFRLFHN